MQRRKLLLATGGALATATAGCLGTDSGSETEPQSDVNAEVEFSVGESDLVVSHVSGNVLQTGESVYITIDGDQVAEKTLNDDVHTGGEIMRVNDVKDEFSGERRVGLYLQQSGSPQEIAVTTITISRTYPAPQTQIDFDYTASTDTLEVNHDGGAAITSDNTGVLSVTDGYTSYDWDAAVDDGQGEGVYDGVVQDRLTAGDTFVTIEGGGCHRTVRMAINGFSVGGSEAAV